MSARANRSDDRGQLVLLAAGVLVAALAAILLTYLQLGYHDDVAASADYERPGWEAQRYLDRAVAEAGAGIPANHRWSNRSDAVTVVRSRLDGRVATFETARLESGTVARTRYNRSAARDWASDQCPGGTDRQFGSCEARRGVVVQDRLGRVHVLAVAMDATVTTERGSWNLTMVAER
jgi:hypothetical protein